MSVHVAMGVSVLLAISRCESRPAITVHTAWKMYGAAVKKPMSASLML